MAYIKIGTHSINVDIEAELREFDWERPKWTSDKLIAASPFRYDKTPSFFVNIEGEYAGCFGDSGAYDDEYKSGGFVKLLAFLRNETHEENEQYLLEKYGVLPSSDEYLLILPKLSDKKATKKLEHAIINKQCSPYLTKRGISEDVQAQAGVGKSKHYGFVAIPWMAPDGSLANVKYRATRGKTFFYEKDATPIRELVYGADLYVKSSDDLIVCEAEIDALSWRTAGYNAVAVGGVAFTKQQADILRRLPFTRLLVAGDSDKAGQRFNSRVVSGMKSKDIALIQLDYDGCKDANDVLRRYGVQALRDAVEKALELPRFGVRGDV